MTSHGEINAPVFAAPAEEAFQRLSLSRDSKLLVVSNSPPP